MQSVGLQTHIWNNNLRSAALLAGFPVLLLLMVYGCALLLAGDPAEALRWMAAGAPLAIVVSLVWFTIAYFANTAIIAAATGALSVSRTEAPELYNALENLCISRGLKTPRLQIIDAPEMNAFASGLNEAQYTVTVTRGLLDALTPAELEAVLAHELTHVMNRDVRTMVIASVFAGIITLLAQLIYRAIAWGGAGRGSRDRKGGGGFAIVIAALAIAAVGYILAIVIRMSLSRTREFVADAGAVELTKNPDAMISALQKISGHAALPSPEAVQGMFIENLEVGAYSLFATHPPIEKRIEALVTFGGGRVSEIAPAQAEGWLPESAADPAVVGESDGPWGPHPKGPWG